MKYFLAFFFLLCFVSLQAQELPSQWSVSPDGKYLLSGAQASGGLYDESTIEEIRLYFEQPNYWTLMTNNYTAGIDIPAKLVYKDKTLDSVGVRFKGQTSYFANNSQKKSFNVSIDSYQEDQRLEGYKTLNLNNAFQDVSFMREVLYYHLIRSHTPAPKANFVKLYLNDQYWGVYLNVQQLNKDYLEEWYESNDGNNFRADTPIKTQPGGGGGGGGAQWGDGTAAINYLGEDTLVYQKYYTLKSSGYQNPWSELVDACNVLNNSGNALETTLPEVFDLDKILWHLASEIAFVDDDSYVFKGKMDYYLYQDPITGRWATYDYDANSVMSNDANRINWSPFYNEGKVNYPLLNKVLKIGTYRQRYLAHLRTILNTSFDVTKADAIIDKYDALIKEHVFADTKKTTTNQAYTNSIATLKNFIRNRKNYLLNHVDVNRPVPTLADVKYTSRGVDFGAVTKDDEVTITATPGFSSGLSEVNLWVSTGFTGAYLKMGMNDNAQNGDVIANDGVYSITLPTYLQGTMVKFYVEAIANDDVKTRVFFPERAEQHVMFFKVENSLDSNKIAINEFMASNQGIIKDEFDESEDWIELFNLTNQDINIAGYSITDKPDNPTKFVFAEGTVIGAHDYLIVWADENKSQGPLHANFKLSASGEQIFLYDNAGTLLDSVSFGQQTTNKSAARMPNGTGNWVIGDHTFDKNNETSTAVNAEENTSSWTLYPNPAHGFFVLENNGTETSLVEMYSRMGEKVQSWSLPAQSTTVVSDLAAGLYFVKSGGKTMKVVIF